MATTIITVILSLVLVLALINAGLPDYKVNWFPGKKRWVLWTYDHWDRPLTITYDWATDKTTVFGPEVWSADYYHPRPGWWIVDGCPVSYRFVDSMGRQRYIFRTSKPNNHDGLVEYFWDDIYAPRKPSRPPEGEDGEFIF